MSEPRTRRARRVQLAVPASNERMIAKAAASSADHVFLDLEDACAPNEKRASRARIVAALNELDWRGKTRCVRINDLTTEYAFEDIIEVVEGAGANLDTILLPKPRSAADVQFVDTLLGQLEKKLRLARPIGIEALIEEVEGLQQVEAIARASPRLECLVFGMGDFAASMAADTPDVGVIAGYPGDGWHYARFRVGMACRAAGIDAVDGPYANFRDAVTYREEARRARALGFVGKWAIHPAQIDIALAVFTPSREEVERARRLVAAYAQAEARGLGAIAIDGVMVDVGSVRILRNTLRLAQLYGL